MDEPRTAPARIYVLAAHPNWRESRVTRQLFDEARAVPGVRVQDLYGTYPDYDIDISAEQANAEAARLLVLLHPIQWYAMPALMKLWCDEVLRYGWAYGPGGAALRGKDLLVVASTSGPDASYYPEGSDGDFFDAFLPPYRQTAAVCGMRFLPPLLLHAAPRTGEAAVQEHVQLFRERLQGYPAED